MEIPFLTNFFQKFQIVSLSKYMALGLTEVCRIQVSFDLKYFFGYIWFKNSTLFVQSEF